MTDKQLTLKIGQRIRVKLGGTTFHGMCGTIERESKQGRVWVRMEGAPATGFPKHDGPYRIVECPEPDPEDDYCILLDQEDCEPV